MRFAPCLSVVIALAALVGSAAEARPPATCIPTLTADCGGTRAVSPLEAMTRPRWQAIQDDKASYERSFAGYRARVRRSFPLDGDRFVADVLAGWYVNDTLRAFKHALAAKKPLVFFGVNRYCGYCYELIEQVFPCPSLQRFAQFAVFLVTEPGDMHTFDAGGKVIADALKYRGYPTISLLAPDPDKIHELARIEGFFPAKQLSITFERELARYTAGKLLSPEAAEKRMKESGSLPNPAPKYCDTGPVRPGTQEKK